MTNLWLWKGACSRVSSGCISFAPFLSSMRRRRLEWCNCTLLVWLKGLSMLPGDRNETGSHAGHLYMYINISSLYLTKNSNSVGLRIKMVVTSSEKPRSGLKWPFTIVPKIRSMASSLGIVTFKMKKCLGKGVFMIIYKKKGHLFSLSGMSFLPPPGWIMAARYLMSC